MRKSQFFLHLAVIIWTNSAKNKHTQKKNVWMTDMTKEHRLLIRVLKRTFQIVSIALVHVFLSVYVLVAVGGVAPWPYPRS